MSFKKNKYTVIRKAISKDLASFVANYFLMQKQVYDTCKASRYFSPFETILGHYENKDEQIPDTYSQYANIAMETLLLKCQPQMEKVTGLKLYPAYTYARIYKKGDVLKRHKDRFSCEISTTLNLGGDEWPIFISPKENVGAPDGKTITAASNAKGIEVTLEPGDMLMYRGCILEHWREVFTGKDCGQVFLHYNDANSKDLIGGKTAEENKFDGREHLGLPSSFKNQ